MSGILPDSTSAGAVAYRDALGNPLNPPNVTNAYSPPPTFVVDCPLTALPNDCNARIEPRQINAIVSELIGLAECFDANGPWHCATINNLCTAFSAFKVTSIDTKQNLSEKGQPNGYAGLDSTGKVPTSQLPSYVDDVVEVANFAALPLPGETGKIYITTDTGKTYRWTGSVYIEISGSDDKVAKAGDVMTGDLRISKPSPAFILDKQSGVAEANTIFGQTNGLTRWQAILGDGAVAEGAGNTGSDFVLYAFDNAGAFVGEAIRISRATAKMKLHSDPVDPLGAVTKQYSDKAIRTDVAQSFTAVQRTQARINAYAAPLDALAFNGMQVNGNFDVSQQYGSNAAIVIPPNVLTPTLDQWVFQGSTTTTGRVSVYRQNAVGVFPVPSYIGIYPTASQASMATGDAFLLRTIIEGWRVARLQWGTPNAQPISISFWCNHSIAGTYSICVANTQIARSFVTWYTQNVAGVAEFKTITIPGDLAGSWQTEANSSLQIDFTLAAGSAFTGSTPNTWTASGGFQAVPAQVNAIQSGASFRLSGFLLLPWTESPIPERAPFIQRPFAEELLLCKRYFRRLGGEVTGDVCLAGVASAASQAFMYSQPLEPAMRIAPTVAEFGTWAKTNVLSTFYFPSTMSLGWQIQSAAAGPASAFGNIGGLYLNARM